MKKFLFSISLSLISVFAFSQWTWQNPLPQGNPLKSVYFTDSNTGYAVGDLGTILKTNNGGTTWTVLSSGTTNRLYSVYFTDANTGYAVGGEYLSSLTQTGIILKTSDGGITWTVSSSGLSKIIKSSI